MPSPLGHALAGLTVAWLAADSAGSASPASPVTAGVRQPACRTFSPIAWTCVALAVAPDLDILVGAHRTISHSISAALVAGLAGAVFATRPWWSRWSVQRTAAAWAAAWGSHVLLDWLGRDGSVPLGIMALWPLSHRYWTSGLDLFAEVSRRYWLPHEFIAGNLLSVARELAILGPLALAAWAIMRRDTRRGR